ncbi:uncharacterized protein C8A04DRAFT_26070 [Dichotomopilus funicola]|uniref:Complex I-B15 n=1 Tax=Dichotomopilus funicola TaxID=1934379 RepID=A0AAN6V7J3_9PEZI|nr:hypothetical protein C8A04DRAFT_26070 [Dichotomopilus funicola]
MSIDPAFARLENMQRNRYKYFRWNRKTAFVSFMYIIVVPSFVAYLGYATDGLWELRGKRRGNPISER